MKDTNKSSKYVNDLIKRAKHAQKVAETYSQEKVDDLVAAIAWTAVNEVNARELSELACQETQMGNFDGKYLKLTKKPRGVLWEMKGAKSVGVIEIEEKKGILKIAKPVGVIGAIVPCTNPAVTPVLKAMCAIKGRNATVFSPHPRSKKTTYRAIELMRQTLKEHGAPEDLLICVENPNLEISYEVMNQCDLIIATGGSRLVKAAYSSGKPAYGVGVGNAISIIDETANIEDAAHKIMLSKTNDLATGCSTENALLINNIIYKRLISALEKEGGYLLNDNEKKKLQKKMWINGQLNREVICKPASQIADIAGFSIPEDITFLMVKESGIGREYPFSGEKLSVVLALYRYEAFDEAISKINDIHAYMGAGHSCGIHSFDEENIRKLYLNTKTSRIMIRQPQNYGNAGNWNNGMPWTTTLGCGTWGGNITTENITWKHFINVTWVSYPIDPVIPNDEELFGELCMGKSLQKALCSM